MRKENEFSEIRSINMKNLLQAWVESERKLQAEKRKEIKEECELMLRLRHDNLLCPFTELCERWDKGKYRQCNL